MSYNSNNVYISPITNEAVLSNPCNYSPIYPCNIAEPYTQVNLSYPPFNPEYFNASLQQSIHYANAVANQAQAILTSDPVAITFNPQAIGTVQDNVDKTFNNLLN